MVVRIQEAGQGYRGVGWLRDGRVVVRCPHLNPPPLGGGGDWC
ncbi:hypothetical protein [Azospirillum largimobile]